MGSLIVNISQGFHFPLLSVSSLFLSSQVPYPFPLINFYLSYYTIYGEERKGGEIKSPSIFISEYRNKSFPLPPLDLSCSRASLSRG
jgi:hypothetical protein